MQEKVFSFEEQFKVGQVGEKVLDDHFRSLNIDIKLASETQQRCGIDRIFTRPPKGDWEAKSYSVEYKMDTSGHRTGNIWLETVSVETTSCQKPGWVYTCQADWIFYYLSGAAQVYMLSPSVIKSHISGWLQLFPLRRIKNRGYYTVGLLVPSSVVARVAEEIFTVNEHQEGRQP